MNITLDSRKIRGQGHWRCTLPYVNRLDLVDDCEEQIQLRLDTRRDVARRRPRPVGFRFCEAFMLSVTFNRPPHRGQLAPSLPVPKPCI